MGRNETALFFVYGKFLSQSDGRGLARNILDPSWHVASAGIEAHGLNPLAVQVMAEIGIDISQQTSTVIDLGYLRQCDLVVTLCGDARDRCPVTPATVKRIHWPLADPAQATGSVAERLLIFRQVRDEIARHIKEI